MYLRATSESRHWTLKGVITSTTLGRETCGTFLPDTLTRSKALVPADASSSSSLMTATLAKILPFYSQTGLVSQHPSQEDAVKHNAYAWQRTLLTPCFPKTSVCIPVFSTTSLPPSATSSRVLSRGQLIWKIQLGSRNLAIASRTRCLHRNR